MTTKGKILVLVSSGYGLPLKNGGCYRGAGYYLNELTVPVRALMQEGYEITFSNPKGNTPQLDLHSAVPDFFGGDEARLQDYFKFRDSLTGLKKSNAHLGCRCIRPGSIRRCFRPRRPWPDDRSSR
jgi:hypothetical protein